MRDRDQIWLIISGLTVTALFGIFAYREMFPEYKLYQKDYIALEQFRSTYTHEEPPKFSVGVKQIVLERDDKGPAVVDRCTSCHVALEVPYFSPTKLSRDIDGHIVRDVEGRPLQVENEDYIWAKLDETIADLRNEKVNEQLAAEGRSSDLSAKLKLADEYESLKFAHVGEQKYDVRKVLMMHPLMGNETRPFEYHPVEEYGCTSCHNGNGHGLVTDKAHGPVFDGQYEGEFQGPSPKFSESDPLNDPTFARVFNSKPSHELLFQTEPLFVGSLIQAKCVQCHQTSEMRLENTGLSTDKMAAGREKKFKLMQQSFEEEKAALASLLSIRNKILLEGPEGTFKYLKGRKEDDSLTEQEIERAASQEKYLQKVAEVSGPGQTTSQVILEDLNKQLAAALGSDLPVDQLQVAFNENGKGAIDTFLTAHEKDPSATGELFVKAAAIGAGRDLTSHARGAHKSFETILKNPGVASSLESDVDGLTRNYQAGSRLYLSQACYACHRIAGLARGGVGPELTRIGDQYPWYIKQSIIWPQADLRTSTMPNMRLDHGEVEDLMTFLLAQKGGNKSVAESDYLSSLHSWEAGRKLPWEKPVSPAQIHDLNYSMTVFATEGCAACHRLTGYESDVGFKVEREKPSFDVLYEEQKWFKNLFPETIAVGPYDEPLPGSSIVETIKTHAQELDERILGDIRQNSLLEEIEKKYPETIESFYSNFSYAFRARDHEFDLLLKNEENLDKRAQIRADHEAWKGRVKRVLMTYIQVYGLGRLIGPRPNWSGIYRTDQWLIEHFRNPAAHVPRSIMPVMPFDDTKFYALTYMLDVLGVRNRNATRSVWEKRGFDPREAYEIHCMQCHGQSLAGNGPVSEWIYPVPKNLRNPAFMNGLTKEKAFYSITHGVKGTPMPPLGEVAQDKNSDIEKASDAVPVLSSDEITRIVNWLFDGLPGGEVFKDAGGVPRWNYKAEDVLLELKKEGGTLGASEEPAENLIFDVVEADSKDLGRPSYYIKKKYYTAHNIMEGEKFFLLNCAACHGNEGDGTGARGVAMQDAKPRMLTNLDWIHSRDDLRLLSSIKYGVTGTSMTPWGDLTNPLQRLQLVMFIRSLSKDRESRERLNVALYQSFDKVEIMIDQARAADGEQRDPLFLELKEEVKGQRELYSNLGSNLINKNVDEGTLNLFYELIRTNEIFYSFKGDRLSMHLDPVDIERLRSIGQKIVDSLERDIKKLEGDDQPIKGNVASVQKVEEQAPTPPEVVAYKKLRNRVKIDIDSAIRSLEKQRDLIRQLENENKPK
jgi:mono/diheme cytochrome c family protein